MAPLTSELSSQPIAAPEPHLTPEEMIRRARVMRPWLRERQADCETTGNIPQDVNAELIRCGFYRAIQPRRFGGYEFDVADLLQGDDGDFARLRRDRLGADADRRASAGGGLVSGGRPARRLWLERRLPLPGGVPAARQGGAGRGRLSHQRQMAVGFRHRSLDPCGQHGGGTVAAQRGSQRSDPLHAAAPRIQNRRRLACHGHAGHRLQEHRGGRRVCAAAPHRADGGPRPCRRRGFARTADLRQSDVFRPHRLLPDRRSGLGRGRRRARSARSLRRRAAQQDLPAPAASAARARSGIPAPFRPGLGFGRDRRSRARSRGRGLHGLCAGGSAARRNLRQ